MCRTGSTILTGICFPPLVLKLIQGNGLSGSVVRVSKLENIWRFFSTNAILRFSLEHTKLSRSLEDSFGISITSGWFSWVEIAHLVSDSEAALPSPLVSNNLGRTSEDENSEFPVTYISFPSSKDPTWDNEHPGTATLEAIVPTSFNSVEKWKDKPWKKRAI